MIRVYDLRDDSERMKRSTRGAARFGVSYLDPHGIPGSEKWFGVLEQGKVLVTEVEGVVCELLPNKGGTAIGIEHGAGEDFFIIQRTAYKHRRISQLFALGRRVRVVYFDREMQPKKAQDQGDIVKTPIEIWAED